MLSYQACRRVDFRVGNGFQPPSVRSQNKRAFKRQLRVVLKVAALGIVCRIEPVSLLANPGPDDHMIKSLRRRLPTLDRVSRVGVNQRERTIDMHVVQDRRQQQRLVLAIAEAAGEGSRRWIWLMRVRSQLDSQIADF